MGKATVALGALLIVAGGGALGFAFTRHAQGGMTPEATSAMTEAIGRLDGDLKSARSEVQSRSVTFAGLLSVRSGVEGDVDTLQDLLTAGTLDFKPMPTEVIELGNHEGGKVNPLLTQPPGSPSPAHDGKAGQYLELVGTDVVITAIVETVKVPENPPLAVPVPPKGGYVAVSRHLALGEAIGRLSAAKIAGKFELGAVSIPIGGGLPDPLPSGAKLETMPLASESTAHIVVMVPATTVALPVPIVGAGAGAAALGLLLLVIGMMSKGGAAAGTRGLSPTGARGPASISTQPGVGAASGAAGTGQSFRNVATKMSGTHESTPPPADGESPFAQEVLPGTMIGRWEVVKRLGSGGMADVYLARSKGEAGFEKAVAIKVMHHHLARNQRAVDHFLDEARLAARIVHPNVVAIQDLGKIGNDYVIVMDYVEGVDLERMLASARAGQRPVPVDIGLGILCRICDGLNAAHTALGPDGMPLGVIHRDVKSANVLVSKQGGVKVVDFGIAKAANQSHLTIQGETKGTPSMMAPEQRVGERVDVRADVYSVGAVAYEVLTGHAVNLDLAALAHLGVENWPHLPPPTQLRPDLPVELDAILLTAMSFERDKRPPNCAAFEATFEAVMKQYGLGATDKDIARWVDSEMRILQPGYIGMPSSGVNPVTGPGNPSALG